MKTISGKRKLNRSLRTYLSLLLTAAMLVMMLPMGTKTAIAAGSSVCPYGSQMSDSSVTLKVDPVADATYQWQSSASENGTFSDVSGGTGSTITLSNPGEGTWYRCVINGTPSKAVMVLKRGSNWEGSDYMDYDTSYYVGNGKVAYMLNESNCKFNVVGLFTKNGTDYMLGTSYNNYWSYFSSTTAEPSASSSGNSGSASVDSIKILFDSTNEYTVNFQIDLSTGQKAFAFGCDTMLGSYSLCGYYADDAALDAIMSGNTLNQIVMIGAATIEGAAETDPAFIIRPITQPDRFWLGYWNSRMMYAYNSTTGTGYTTSTINGQTVVTSLEGMDSGMTMSWFNLSDDDIIEFQFAVGDAGSIGALSAGINYADETLTDLEPGETYKIVDGDKSYVVTADENGTIPLSGTDNNGEEYDLIGKTISITQIDENGKDVTETKEVDVAGRPDPENPDGVTTQAEDIGEDDVVVTDTTIKVKTVPGQEYRLDDGTWVSPDSDGYVTFTGLDPESEHTIYTRVPATDSAPASVVSDGISVATVCSDFENVTEQSYEGVYDGASHEIKVTTDTEGATITYSSTEDGIYTSAVRSYTDVCSETVYYRIEKEHYNTVTGTLTAVIKKADIPGVSSEDVTVTYDGEEHGITVTKPDNAVVSYKTSESGSYREELPVFTDAGTYTVYYLVSVDGNYNTIEGQNTVTINPADFVVTKQNYEGIYDGEAHEIKVTTDVEDAVITYSSTEDGEYTSTVRSYTDVCSETIYYRIERANYNTVTGTLTAVITKADIPGVSSEDVTVTYDGAEHGIFLMKPDEATVSYKTSEDGSYSTEEPLFTDAGTYTVFYQVSIDDNYNPIEGQNTVTIEPKELVLSWGEDTFTYNGEVQNITVEATNVVDGDTVNLTETEGQINAADTPYTAEVTAVDNDNYVLPEDATKQFMISAKPVSITVEDTGKHIGEEDPELTCTVDGVIEGEELTGLTVTRAEGEEAGEYELTASVEIEENPNYLITIGDPAVFTIEDHDWSEYISDNNASTENNGTETSTCSICGATDTREIPGSQTEIEKEIIPGEEETIGQGTLETTGIVDTSLPETEVTGLTAELVKSLLTEEELALVEEGAYVNVFLTIVNITDNVPEEDKAAVEEIISTLGDDAAAALYLDVSMYRKLNDEVPVRITDTNGQMITVSIRISEVVSEAAENVDRTCYLVRVHDGAAELLPFELDEDGMLTFETDKFSTYGVVCKDTEIPEEEDETGEDTEDDAAAQDNQEENASDSDNTSGGSAPKTGDSLRLSLVFTLLLASFGAMLILKKREQSRRKQ